MTTCNNLIKVIVIVLEEGGDGRFRPSTTRGAINPDNISSAQEFYHGELAKTCSRLMMKTGEKIELLGPLDLILDKSDE